MRYKNGRKGGKEGEKGELNVANPEVGLRIFENHFKVNACQA